jgi:hypothetical protein
MADDDDDSEPQKPSLRVVSDNQSVPDKEGRARQYAKDEAERTLAVAAATMLRVIAGSESAASDLRNDMVRAILAEEKYHELAGQWLASWDRTNALALPQPKIKEDSSDRRYRAYERDCGMQDIVQGSLRLAAHQVLGERPHFGGKYSQRLIERGMDAVKRAYNPPPPPPKPTNKKERAQQKEIWADVTNAVIKSEPEPPRKRWSSRDSKSYRDLKPEE